MKPQIPLLVLTLIKYSKKKAIETSNSLACIHLDKVFQKESTSSMAFESFTSPIMEMEIKFHIINRCSSPGG
jgi:hypothetical protein